MSTIDDIAAFEPLAEAIVKIVIAALQAKAGKLDPQKPLDMLTAFVAGEDAGDAEVQKLAHDKFDTSAP